MEKYIEQNPKFFHPVFIVLSRILISEFRFLLILILIDMIVSVENM